MRSKKAIEHSLLFKEIVEQGSFSAAGKRLGIGPSMVSQHIKNLEEELGVTLFHRSTRQLRLTEAGQVYWEGCQQIIKALDNTQEALQNLNDEPSGLLRITADTDYGVDYLIPIIAQFMKRYPKVGVELVLDDANLDFLEHKIDLAIRLGNLKDSSLRATKLRSTRRITCATPEYLAQFPQPQTPRDLQSYQWITLNPLSNSRQLAYQGPDGECISIPTPGHIRTNTGRALLAFLCEGVGITVLPDFMVQSRIESGVLVEVLPQYKLPQAGIYIVFPSTQTMPLKVRTFINFVKSHLKTSLLESSPQIVARTDERE